jgi:hypothetical protein
MNSGCELQSEACARRVCSPLELNDRTQPIRAVEFTEGVVMTVVSLCQRRDSTVAKRKERGLRARRRHREKGPIVLDRKWFPIEALLHAASYATEKSLGYPLGMPSRL